VERVFHPCAGVPVSLEFVRVTGSPAGARRRCHRKSRGGKSRKEATVRIERYLSAWYDRRGLRVMELDGVVLHTRTKAQCARCRSDEGHPAGPDGDAVSPLFWPAQAPRSCPQRGPHRTTGAAATPNRYPSRGRSLTDFQKNCRARRVAHTTSRALSGRRQLQPDCPGSDVPPTVRNSTNFADCPSLYERETSVVQKWTIPRISSGS
jgi:hypothetical protein